MEEQLQVNSRDYWDSRFEKDWVEKHGPEQSRFFSYITQQALPTWLYRHLEREDVTFVDYGCGRGDGTDAWVKYVSPRRVTGVDFSAESIKQAANLYPSLTFKCEDWLSKTYTRNTAYNVLYCSNTLEHLRDPVAALATLGAHARDAMILTIPFRESPLFAEHLTSFFPGNVPAAIDECWFLVSARVADCRSIPDSLWFGEQLVCVYASLQSAKALGLALNSLATDIELQETIRVTQNDLRTTHDALRSSQDRITTLTDALLKANSENASMKTTLADALLKANSENASMKSTLTLQEAKMCEIANHNNNLEQSIIKLKRSISWRVTLPLRLAIRLALTLGTSCARTFRWSTQTLSHGFQRLTSATSRLSRIRASRQQATSSPSQLTTTSSYSDATTLTWNQFEKSVLANRQHFRGVFVFDYNISWNIPLFQRPQHIASALAELGYLVLYKLDNLWGDHDFVTGCKEIRPNLWLIHHDAMPPLADSVRIIYSTASQIDPETAFHKAPGEKVVYEYIDHLDEAISGSPEIVARLVTLKNKAFEGHADHIVATARKLHTEVLQCTEGDRSVLIPNGVDTRHYSGASHQHSVLPDAYLAFKRKHNAIVGYFGALAPWLDYTLIAALTSMRPDLGFIFIGPDYFGGSYRLPSAPNLIYPGAVNYKDLPAYASLFDVCWLPFAEGEIAQTTSPLKLYEYFALGKPVVATSDMLECLQYPEVFHGRDAASLAKAIQQALATAQSADFLDKCLQLASSNDWRLRARQYDTFINQNPLRQ